MCLEYAKPLKSAYKSTWHIVKDSLWATIITLLGKRKPSSLWGRQPFVFLVKGLWGGLIFTSLTAAEVLGTVTEANFNSVKIKAKLFLLFPHYCYPCFNNSHYKDTKSKLFWTLDSRAGIKDLSSIRVPGWIMSGCYVSAASFSH